jgi:hypothetical protein
VRAELARESLVTGAGLTHLPVDRKLSITGIVLIRQRPRCHTVRCTGKLQREKSVIHIIVDHLDDMPRLSTPCATALAIPEPRVSSKPPFVSTAKTPGYDARDSVIARRNFR